MGKGVGWKASVDAGCANDEASDDVVAATRRKIAGNVSGRATSVALWANETKCKGKVKSLVVPSATPTLVYFKTYLLSLNNLKLRIIFTASRRDPVARKGWEIPSGETRRVDVGFNKSGTSQTSSRRTGNHG